MIMEYYALLEHGSYREAYQLLGPSLQQRNFEEYQEGVRSAFKTVQILSIQPYSEWAIAQGYKNPKTSARQNHFVVTLVAVGDGPMSGSVPSGQQQILFISVAGMDGLWKIMAINTAP